MKIIKEIVLTLLVTLFCVEGLAWFMVMKLHYTNLWHNYPTYTYWGKTTYKINQPQAPRFIDSDQYTWGTWHIPNSTCRHSSTCFNAELAYNSIGARGTLPSPTDTSTVIFLGDSFTEGYGLSQPQTFVEQYAQQTKSSALNLGISGAGTTQMELIYQHFAPKFKHKAVVVCLYLDNDYTDDDPNQYYQGRYRPYRVYNAHTKQYSIQYKESIDKSTASINAINSKTSDTLLVKYSLAHFFSKKTLPTYNLFQKILSTTYTSRLIAEMYYRAQSNVKPPAELSATKQQLQLLEFNLAKISTTARNNGARAYFCNVPSLSLLLKVQKNDKLKVQYEIFLKRLAQKSNMNYIPSLSYFSAYNPQDLFFTCDAHFNAKGASVFANTLKLAK
jgi:lysophospholipase L1-like esterase